MSTVADLPLIASGKVREIYDLEDKLLLVASDRVSTYDAVHPTSIPGKGAVLTGLTHYWLTETKPIVRNHMVSVTAGVPEDVRGRAMIVKKLQMLPVEAVVRGYLSGSGWRDYAATGSVSGIALGPGLTESARLPEPLFTPSTKAAVGSGHDEAISFDQAAELIGSIVLTEQMKDAALAVYRFAAARALERGIILADTKFEFGLDADGILTLGDEVCTPDSSRFWPVQGYAPGRTQPSFDKQFVRDWATSTGWNKLAPAPEIPSDVVTRTREKYVDAYERITGEFFSEWLTKTGAA